MKIKTTRTPICYCPCCNAEIDSATDPMNKYTPEPGDASICFNCLAWLLFNDDLSLRMVTDDDIKEIPPLIKTYEQAIREFKKI